MTTVATVTEATVAEATAMGPQSRLTRTTDSCTTRLVAEIATLLNGLDKA